MKHFFKLSEKNIISICLLFIFGIIIIQSFSYNINAQRLPLFAGLIGLIMVSLQIIVEIFPEIRILKFINKSGISFEKLSSEEKTDMDKEEKENNEVHEHKETVRNIDVLYIFLWLLAFVILIKYITYLIIVPLFTFSFLKFQAKEGTTKSFLSALIFGICIYVIFELLLNSQF